MQGSILITGGTKKNRLQKCNDIFKALNIKKSENNPDYLKINPGGSSKTLGIDNIRDMIKFSTRPPFSGSNKAVFIESCHTLTVQAQNALLKTLEEPPEYLSIILETQNENGLLETVISRCLRINLSKNKDSLEINNIGEDPGSDQISTSFTEITQFSKGERLSWCIESSKSDKNDILQMLESWIEQSRQIGEYKSIPFIDQTKKDLENTNISTKLALETLTLNL